MKIMMIGAHPDDLELNGAGLARKYIKAGHQVRFLILCNGSKGHHILSPEETAKTRAAESAAVRECLQLTDYSIWSDVEDCELEVTLENRKRLIREIRSFAPDIVIGHRPNDYHADHRAAGQLVQDASYMLIVPHMCLEVPAMRKMPVIMYFEDKFTAPNPFVPDVVIGIDEEMPDKIQAMRKSPSQFYQWLPYSYGEENLVPEDEEGKLQYLCRGLKPDLTDEEALQAPKKYYAVRSAKVAARFRKELIARYGEEKGRKIRFAEAFQICEYGAQPTQEELNKLFWF